MNTIDTEWEEYKKECDDRFNHKAFWTRRFAFLPHRCDITKKLIWLRFAFRGDRYYFCPADYIVESRWHTPKAHTYWALIK